MLKTINYILSLFLVFTMGISLMNANGEIEFWCDVIDNQSVNQQIEQQSPFDDQGDTPEEAPIDAENESEEGQEEKKDEQTKLKELKNYQDVLHLALARTNACIPDMYLLHKNYGSVVIEAIVPPPELTV